MSDEGDDAPLYTLGLMSDVLGMPKAAIRHWVRHGLLTPSRRVGSLEWFDFEQMVAGRRLAAIMASGLTVSEIDAELAALGGGDAVAAARADGRIVRDGRRLLLYCDGRLVGGGGQLHFQFLEDAVRCESPHHPEVGVIPAPIASEPLAEPENLLDLAAELAAEGHLVEACEALRAILQSAPPTAEVTFLLAELLYRSGDLTAARERFYMAIEIDPDHLAARTSLGCLLAEMNETELAIAALDGVVSQQPDFADAHWQLAGLLEETGRFDEARGHLEAFVRLAPESPWTDAAREKLLCLS